MMLAAETDSHGAQPKGSSRATEPCEVKTASLAFERASPVVKAGPRCVFQLESRHASCQGLELVPGPIAADLPQSLQLALPHLLKPRSPREVPSSLPHRCLIDVRAEKAKSGPMTANKRSRSVRQINC
jgi:hypothetical protein